MKMIHRMIPLYDIDLYLIQLESYNDIDDEAFSELYSVLGHDYYTNLIKEITEDKPVGGANTIYSPGDKAGVVIFNPPESRDRSIATYGHEKRHIEDDIINHVGIEGLEAAGYLAGFLTIWFVELFILSTSVFAEPVTVNNEDEEK